MRPLLIRTLPTSAAAATGILVGAAIVATRFVIDQAGPASLALLRYFIGACCLLPPVFLSARIRMARRDLAPIALLGIAQFGILIWLMNFGLQFISSGRAALIFASFPLLTMLLAVGLGHERLTLAKTLGVLVAITGVGLALGEKAARLTGSTHAWVGELALFASALCGAACSVLYRPYLRKYPALPVSALAMVASVAFLTLLAAAEGFFVSWPRFSVAGWLAVAFIGISSGVGYYLWLWALARRPATQVTVFLALSPVTATGLGAVLLGETVSWLLLLGLSCVVFGLWLAHRASSSPRSRDDR